MIEPHKRSYWQLKKKNSVNEFQGQCRVNERKNIYFMLHKTDAPRLRSTTENICVTLSGICISPVILQSRRANAHLLVNPIPKLTIVLIWKTPACLKFGKTSNRAVENLPQRKLWVWARTMHVLIRIWSHRTSASACFFGNDRSSHSRIRTSLYPMSVYCE